MSNPTSSPYYILQRLNEVPLVAVHPIVHDRHLHYKHKYAGDADYYLQGTRTTITRITNQREAKGPSFNFRFAGKSPKDRLRLYVRCLSEDNALTLHRHGGHPLESITKQRGHFNTAASHGSHRCRGPNRGRSRTTCFERNRYLSFYNTHSTRMLSIVVQTSIALVNSWVATNILIKIPLHTPHRNMRFVFNIKDQCARLLRVKSFDPRLPKSFHSNCR